MFEVYASDLCVLALLYNRAVMMVLFILLHRLPSFSRGSQCSTEPTGVVVQYGKYWCGLHVTFFWKFPAHGSPGKFCILLPFMQKVVKLRKWLSTDASWLPHCFVMILSSLFTWGPCLTEQTPSLLVHLLTPHRSWQVIILLGCDLQPELFASWHR